MTQTELIFNIQMMMSLLVGGLVVAWYVLPKFRTWPLETCLVPCLLIAGTRFHGLNFLVSDLNQGLSPEFTVLSAYGDFTASILALVGAVVVRKNLQVGKLVVWLYLVVGAVDLARGIYVGNLVQMPLHLGATWFAVLWEVPVQLLNIFVLVWLLTRHKSSGARLVHGN